ncbi:hypothetical protein [Acidaminococcus sp.]|uniref:hypothetical protein n=1 Tax=Acidaminococcus sp. TaxID=1872103 RepID=UPI003522DDEA
MDEANARMAILRHATSKIVKADDLLTLHTLGFRGRGPAQHRLCIPFHPAHPGDRGGIRHPDHP